MALGIVTDSYVGMSTECMLNSRRLKLAFADVYHSEVGTHRTLMVSEYFASFGKYVPIAAFECLGEIIAEAHSYVRDVFKNTPITLEQYGFDNYFYEGDNRGTASDPFQIFLKSNKIYANLLGDFTIRLPFNNLPLDLFPDAHYLGDRTLQLNHFALAFKRIPKRYMCKGSLLFPSRSLACPCRWEMSSLQHLKALQQVSIFLKL